jgi:Tetracyclin repressor-like, C-terminal domain
VFKNPDLAALVQDRMGGPKRQLFIDMLDRAIARQEIPALDPSIAINLVLGPIFHRFMVDGDSPTPGLVDYLVPMTIAALQAAPVSGRS